jgi:hypothetical protein
VGLVSPDHKRLFDDFVQELAAAKLLAERAFNDEVGKGVSAGQRREDADASVRRRRGPPAAHPRVLAIVRKYYFACHHLNEQKEAAGVDEFVTPIDFVNEHLMGKHEDLWEFLSELVYLPIGVDASGKQV